MNSQNSGALPQGNPAVQDLIRELERKAGLGTSVYRGEPAIYDKVSSGLYRRYAADEVGSGIPSIHEEILSQVRSHAPEMADLPDDDVLAQIQHYGGATNLIDFTEDYLVALFFACDGEPGESGRVVLLPREGAGYYVYNPPNPAHRVNAQKSVLVKPEAGFVEPDDKVVINSDLKQPILDYLHRHHGISSETIYNDLYGFIQYREIHRSAYDELNAGVILSDEDHFQEAIRHYNNALTLHPRLETAYSRRAFANYHLEEYDSAVEDYEKALSFDPEDDVVHHNLGIAYAALGNYSRAIQCYDRALEINPDQHTLFFRFEAYVILNEWDKTRQEIRSPKLEGIDMAALLHEYFGSVSEFQSYNNVELPPDIAELLEGSEATP